MKNNLFLLFILSGILSLNLTRAQIHTETIEYKIGNETYKGYLAYDESNKNKRPGVLVIHEWWGLNDYPKMRAEQLAKMGYIAFAPDMYGNGKITSNPDEAGKLASSIIPNKTLLTERANAGLKILIENSLTNNQKIAAIGFCFGGRVAMEFAKTGADLNAVVAFHPSLPTDNPESAKNIKGKLLVLVGADDKFISEQDIKDFKQQMDRAKVNWQMNAYSNTVHSFSNPDAGDDPSDGLAYNKTAAERSWKEMKMLLDEVFE